MPKDTREIKGAKDTDQFATIQPAELKFGSNGTQDKNPSRKTEKPSVTPYAIGALVVLIGVWVFVFLPGRVTTPDISAEAASAVELPATDSKLQTGELDRSNNDGIAPFEVLDAARARKNTEETLAEFVRLQIQLEDTMQVKQWAAEEYSNIIAIANQGDVLFLEAQYKESMLKYTQGSTALKALVSSGEAQYTTAIKLAEQALDNLDPELAIQSFIDAAIIHPDKQGVTKGRLRANNMPKVLQHLKDAEKLVANSQFEEARQLYTEAQSLDPEMPGISAKLAKLQQRIHEQNFRKYISEAYAALNSGRYQKAEISFRKAAVIKPGNASIRDGLRQLESAKLLAEITKIEVEAIAQVKAEQWTSLPDTYASALELDPNLQFAREGMLIAKKRAKIDTILDKIIANPGELSLDSNYDDALSAFNIANALELQGPRLVSQLAGIKGILEIAAIPVVFQISSDNLTEVGIVRRGTLGVFKSRTLELRPGSYIFTGSRPGCRDFRKTVQVIQGMNNITVQCEESI